MRARMLALTLAAAAFTASCGLLPHRHFTPQAVPVSCDSQCYVPCTTTDIAWTFDATSPAAYDALGTEVAEPLAKRVAECNLSRRACHVCLLRLQEQGVLIGVPPLPPAKPPK